MDAKTLLDQLADFDDQKAVLLLKQQELISQVKVPEEFKVASDEMKKAYRAIDVEVRAAVEILEEERSKLLAEVVVPAEVRAVYEEVQRKRQQIDMEFIKKIREEESKVQARKDKVGTNFSSRVKAISDDIEKRKADIAIEIGGKVSSVDQNINDLRERIKDAVKKAGETVSGNFYQAVYNSGRTTWNTDMLEGMIEALPGIAKARKVGEPSITIRAIKNPKPAPVAKSAPVLEQVIDSDILF